MLTHPGHPEQRRRAARQLALAFVLLPVAAAAQVQATFTSETAPVPGNQAGDTALLRDPWGQWRDLTFGGDFINNGFYGFFVDGGSAVVSAFGAMGGVDARPTLTALPASTPGGLVVASATTAGRVLFFTTHPDAGFPEVGGVNVVTPRALALGDFADAGAFLFLDTGGPTLLQYRLREDGGAVDAVAEPSIALPFAARALATSSSLRRVYASVGVAGVLEIAPLDSPPTVVNLIDAGFAPSEIVGGLAVYPQRDGGALLLTSVPARDLFRVYQLRRGVAVHLTDFTIAAADGGRKIVGAEYLDVWPGAFGVTDAGAQFDAGVLVVCDRLAVAGANYKLVPWASLARATTPPLPIDLPDLVEVPVVTPPPPPLPVAQQQPFARAASDLAFWPGRDALLASLDVVVRLSTVDVSVTGTFDAGEARGLDALGPLSLAPNGLAALSHGGADGGQLSLWTTGADGGLVLVGTSPLASSGPVALAERPDGGAWVFAAADAAVRHFTLTAGDGGSLVTTALSDLQAPGPITSLATLPKGPRLFASTAAGVFELGLTATGSARHLVDAGARALAVYPQRDGGALLVTLDPTGDRFRVFDLTSPPPLPARLEFELGTGDGGVFADAVALDVSAPPAGLLADGGAAWPTGLLAVAIRGADGGRVLLVPWDTLARAATPALPIDGLAAATGAGGGGGPAGGGTNIPIGGRNGGGTAGGGEQPPPGCCTGAPSAALIPGLAFLLWLMRFQRRR